MSLFVPSCAKRRLQGVPTCANSCRVENKQTVAFKRSATSPYVEAKRMNHVLFQFCSNIHALPKECHRNSGSGWDRSVSEVYRVATALCRRVNTPRQSGASTEYRSQPSVLCASCAGIRRVTTMAAAAATAPIMNVHWYPTRSHTIPPRNGIRTAATWFIATPMLRVGV